jgi:hypothetical protein
MNKTIYANIAAVIETIKEKSTKIELVDADKGEILLLDYRSIDGTIRAVPYPPSPYLYRGQIQRFIPCLPALYRKIKQVSHPIDLPKKQLLKYLLSIARLREFEATIRNHPHGKIKNRSVIHIEQTALAQHYGIPTGYLDLTQSLDIASFFATCEPISENTNQIKWVPKKTGEGIIYRFDLTLYNDHHKFFAPLAMPFFKRPYAQKAWAACLRFGIDFETMPGIEKYEFYHNTELSTAILKKFEYGVKLFPVDTLDKIAKSVMSSSNIQKLAIKEAMMHSGILDARLDNIADKYSSDIESILKVKVTDLQKRFLCSVDEWEELLQEEETFFNSLKKVDESKIRDVLNGKIELKDLPNYNE